MRSDPAADAVDRRTFVGTTAGYIVAAALAAACGGGTTAPQGTDTPGGGTTPTGGGSSGSAQAGVTISGSSVSINTTLAGIGTAGQFVILAAVDAIVINVGTGFVALSKTCTHSTCGIARFNNSSSLLECDCHGSRFRTTGVVATGPATAPLRNYPVTVSGSVISFSI
ncbi:MAG: Rieske (2Fe-2S) protein [Gemmatimonadaceae bacterium]